MVPEYHLRKQMTGREGCDVTILPPRSAKGRYRKGEGFNKGLRANRTPIMGDAAFVNEAAIWLARR